MPFCNSCGANIVPGTRFCSKCGAAIVASSIPAPAAATPVNPATPTPPAVPATVPATGSNALKIILIVVGAVVLMGILGLASLAFFGLRMARHSHVRQDGDNVKVETPFGTVQTSKDPQAAARNLGVDIYPGAEPQEEGAASATFGGVHTTALTLESGDPMDKICAFYNSRFPNAMVKSSDANQCTIVSTEQKNVITINIRPEGGKTKIVISNVTHASGSSSSQ